MNEWTGWEKIPDRLCSAVLQNEPEPKDYFCSEHKGKR